MSPNSRESNHNEIQKALRELIAPALEVFIKQKMQEKLGEDWLNCSDWKQFFTKSLKHYKKGNEPNWSDPYVPLTIISNQEIWAKVFQLQCSSDGKDFDTYERGLVNILLGIRGNIAHPKDTADQKHIDKFDKDYTLLAFDVITRLLTIISAPQAPKAEELKQEFLKKYYTELSGTTRKSIEAGINWLSCCSTMLEKQRNLTTNSITKFTAGVELDLDDNYIRLGFVEWKQLEKRNKKDASLKNGSALYEPKGIPIDHDTFFLEVLKQGKSKKSKNNNGKRIAIIGEPGVGKTTQLQKIAFWVLKETECLPIWIPLSQLQGKTIEEYLLKVWLKTATRSGRVTDEMEEALVELFNSGQVWLLLDGVDEMVSESGNALTKISEQLEGWVASAQVVLTCRLNVWDANKNALDNFDVYQKSPFTQEQVSQFISNWFKDNLQSGQRLESELKQAGKERIRDLIKNPLRLALLCLVWESGEGELPDTKAELYEQYINKIYLWKNEIFRADEPLQEALKKALGELAIKALEYQESPFLLRKSFVCNVMNKFDLNLFDPAKDLGLLNRVGLTAEKPIEEVYAFLHRTFQEYFTALNIDNWHDFLNHIPSNPEQGTYRIFKPHWKEVILLWLGLPEKSPEEKEFYKHKKEFIDALVNFNDGLLHQPFYGYEWVPLDEYGEEYQRSFVDFKDSLPNGSFYSFQAFFLAAQGIAEFKNSGYEEVIVKWLVRWGFGYFNDEKLEWYFYCHPIAQAARNALKETDSKKAIQEISNLLKSLTANNDQFWESTLFMRTIQHIATLMGEIGTNNDEASNILIEMLQTCTSSYTLRPVEESLSKIAIGNTKVIAKLIDMMEEFSNNQISHTASILCRIAKGNSNGIKKLITQLKETNNPRYWKKAAWVLGEIGANNQDAIDILECGIQLDWLRNQDIHYKIAEDLLKIAPQHDKAKQIVTESNLSKTKEKNADNSGKTEYEILDEEILDIINSYIINSDDKSLYPPNDENIVEKPWEEVAEALKNAEDAKEVEAIIIPWIDSMTDFINGDEAWASAVSTLEEFVDSSTSPVFSWLIDTCFNMLDADEKLDVHDQAVQTLKNLLSKFNSNELYEDILKKLAPDFSYKNNFGSYEACYEVLWHCVQNMAYVDFCEFWPKPGTNIHPEVAEITPTGNNTLTQSLILANLPQLLKSAIANDPNLNHKVHEICINASEFIKEHRDNPAAEIYAEMVNTGCPERSNGEPETMQSLKVYCKLLKTDKKVVLVFYDSTALEAETIGFSNSFLDDLSNFGEEICVVTERPVKKLKQFSPRQPQLVENILGWIRAILLENLTQ
jgi:type II secretory pathway predicted ATPase ExeA